ncbi:hypothetical protein BH20ACI1_BH20ACI1_03590 [soil metagenome]
MARTNVIKPNEKVFVDTAARIGLLLTGDELHEQATETIRKLRRQDARLITTEAILTEFLNALSAVKFRAKAIAFVDALRTLANVEIILNNVELFEKGLNLYRERTDKNWSLTDCGSFVVMREREINTAFTSDKHFRQAGFVRLLEK